MAAYLIYRSLNNLRIPPCRLCFSFCAISLHIVKKILNNRSRHVDNVVLHMQLMMQSNHCTNICPTWLSVAMVTFTCTFGAHLDERFLQFSDCIEFCHAGPISLCIDLFVFICVYFVCFCFVLHSCCITVNTVGWTWWDWNLIPRPDLYSFSALTLLVRSFDQ